jgi:Ca-activated chloride channel family protein
MSSWRILILSALLAAPVLAEPIEVWIEKPRSTKFVFGDVDFEAAVKSDTAVTAVEFYLDDKKVAEFINPPYRLLVDVGFDNREHEFRVVARDASGQTASSVMVTSALQVDEIVEVDLQQLYVTVTEGGQRVLDLDRGDFRISDDGKRQEIVTFERGDVPITASLILDSSLSMKKGERLIAALQGAEVFLTGMNPLDRAMVMLFSDRVLRMTEFGETKESLIQALEKVEAVGGTAINDHLFLALSRLEMEQGRRVVVLFSDGEDVHSVLSMSDVIQKARSSQALIYWIFLREPGQDDDVRTYTTSWRDADANLKEAKMLRRAIGESGGRIEVVETLAELDDAFVGILAELREQYVVGYYPSADHGDGKWHDVKVRVERSGVAVRTREGYIDY